MVATLLDKAIAARSAAFKAWNEALAPLDRKLIIYESALRDWHAGEGPLPTARAELLTLVMCLASLLCSDETVDLLI